MAVVTQVERMSSEPRNHEKDHGYEGYLLWMVWP